MTASQSQHNSCVHEALDRAHITLSHLEMALEEHPITKKYPDVQAAYEKAVDTIAELYQLIGQKFEGDE